MTNKNKQKTLSFFVRPCSLGKRMSGFWTDIYFKIILFDIDIDLSIYLFYL